MPANVERMAYFGREPWHGLGYRLQENEIYDIQRTIQVSGLDWEVGLGELFTKDGRLVPQGRYTYRKTDNSILGVVGPRYTPLQNRYAFDWFSPFLESRLVSLHTAGSLDNGRKVWVLAKLETGNSEIARGDEVEKFLLLSNSHDGSTAVRVGFTPIRVVCVNTLALAHNSDASKLIRVRHSSQVEENLEAVREIINIANQEFEATAAQYRFLATRQISSKDLEKYVKVVLGVKEDQEEVSTRMRNIIEQILINFEVGEGNTSPAVRGTWWASYNAVNYFLNHIRGNSKDSRLNSLWFGASAQMNQKALETALNMAA